MAKLVQAPMRFNHSEWTTSNLMKYANAEGERIGSERLTDESDRLRDDTNKRTDKTQSDVNKKIDQRIWDIKHWRDELNDKLDGVVKETDNLLAFKVRVEKAIESCAEPLHIARQCLSNREKRIGIDLVHDDVQKELIKEVEVQEGILDLLKRTHEQAVEQVRLNRKAKYQIEKDLKDKDEAFGIDEYCQDLRNNSHEIRHKDGAAKIETNSVAPDEWQNFSNDNINKGEEARMNSVDLRSLIDGILQQTYNDAKKQCEIVNVAFDRRIRECKDVKSKLEDHLNKVLDQIRETELNIARLQKAIDDKDAPLMLAETRLDTRTARPNVELCRDAVQYRLIEEVGEINDSIDNLRMRLHQARESHKALVRNKLDLEEDIAIKSNSIFIDDVECMGMRRSINIQSW